VRSARGGSLSDLGDPGFTAIRRRCVHEAGHTVAALAFDMPIVHVTAAEDDPHLRRGAWRPPNVATGIERVTIVCLAGAQAESRVLRLYPGRLERDGFGTGAPLPVAQVCRG
jgi:hypothetical protein